MRFHFVASCCEIIVADQPVLALFGSFRRHYLLVRRRIARSRRPLFSPLNYGDR
jgi:hypothetical protein